MTTAGKQDTLAGPLAMERRPSASREPGSILGSYRLLEVLGEGGMGIVYLAEHVKLGRKVALKTLRSELATNPDAVRRFFAEARAVNRICHDHIVEITDFVEDGNYYIMELLQGVSLTAAMEATPVMPLDRAVGIMTQVAAALDAVHDAGIIHRDLKPDNIFLVERAGQKDFVKVLDFGVAKLLELGDHLSMDRTASGAVLGTPEYMSPEQACGKEIDHRTDVYAFGAILYELVTGRLPIVARNFAELVVQHLSVAPVSPRRLKDLPHEIPSQLSDLILACLAKEPADRPESMGEVGKHLVAIAATEGWSLTAYSTLPPFDLSGPLKALPLPRPSIQARRRRGRIAMAAVAGVVVAAAAVWVATRPERPAATASSPPAPAAAQIEVEFVTSPPGAAVYRTGESAPLGWTPFTASFAPSDRVQSFELRKPGFEAASTSIFLDRSRRVAATLTESPAPTAAAAVADEAKAAGAGSGSAEPALASGPERAAPASTSGERRRDRKSDRKRPPASAGTATPIRTGDTSPPVDDKRRVDRTGVLNPFE